VEAIGDAPLPVVTPTFEWTDIVGPPSLLRTEDKNHLWHLQQSQLSWYARTDPRALAPLAVAGWPPRRVADLRDGIRLLTGWLVALDDALSDARLLPSPPAEDTADDEGAVRE